MTDKLDIDHLRQWIGRTTEASDIVTAQPVKGLRATLFMEIGEPKPGDAAPWTMHWCLAQPVFPMSELGPDGHPTRGGFLPPVPLPRRMWAGGRLRWEAGNALQVGQKVQRRSTIGSVSHKSGRSGELLFVLVEHAYSNDQGLALTEEHDIVYRAAAQPGDPAPTPQKPPLDGQQTWSRTIVPDDVLLFRYSALTFNGHRIHYDRRYVTGVEGYPGLIVHGPLIATLLLDLLRRELPQAQVLSFEFKAVRPTFDLHAFSVHGKPSADGKTIELWAQDHEGWLTMTGKATLA